jgi:hypothetical protein
MLNVQPWIHVQLSVVAVTMRNRKGVTCMAVKSTTHIQWLNLKLLRPFATLRGLYISHVTPAMQEPARGRVTEVHCRVVSRRSQQFVARLVELAGHPICRNTLGKRWLYFFTLIHLIISQRISAGASIAPCIYCYFMPIHMTCKWAMAGVFIGSESFSLKGGLIPDCTTQHQHRGCQYISKCHRTRSTRQPQVNWSTSTTTEPPANGYLRTAEYSTPPRQLHSHALQQHPVIPRLSSSGAYALRTLRKRGAPVIDPRWDANDRPRLRSAGTRLASNAIAMACSWWWTHCTRWMLRPY